MCAMPTTTPRTDDPSLEALAEDLTRRLGIPFRPSSKASISFREPLRITSWSVPLVFDGHAVWDDGGLVPTDFVGHALWPSLRSTTGRADARPWWHCNLSENAAREIVEHLAEFEPGDGWVIGEDVLLKSPVPPKPATKRRSRQVA